MMHSLMLSGTESFSNLDSLESSTTWSGVRPLYPNTAWGWT